MGIIEDDEDEPLLPIGLLIQDVPVQKAHMRSDDGVGSVITI
jgi:hypothetical protein